MQLKTLEEEGGKVLFGNEVMAGPGFESGCYVKANHL
jgi:hypothetical protein